MSVDAGVGTNGKKIELEVLKYLEDRRTNLKVLQDYPALREMFLRLNTNIPSPTPVERLFSLRLI